MPPIPEDAVVISDYMLMADTVRSTATGNAAGFVHKGVRRLSVTRDVVYSGGAYTMNGPSIVYGNGYSLYSTASGANFSVPFFGSAVGTAQYISDGDRKDQAILIDGSVHGTGAAAVGTYTSGTGIWDNNGVADNASYVASCLLTGITLGSHTLKVTESGSGGGLSPEVIDVATPIHTSSHYQSFETPFLHELVGGDRNMEQTNLVVTADGKTWDEVTRKTDYLGSRCSAVVARDGGDIAASNYYIWDYFRGNNENVNYHTKGFAIGYDRLIFLEAGVYRASLMFTSNSNGGAWRAKLRHNFGDIIQMNQDPDPNEPNSDTCTALIHAQRGDYVWAYIEVGTVEGDLLYRNRFQIEKVG
jgi:hypothetical protein